MSDFDREFRPVFIKVERGQMERFCQIARNAGEDLQAAAWHEYPDDNPTSVRRRNNELMEAQKIIDAANDIARAASITLKNTPKQGAGE